MVAPFSIQDLMDLFQIQAYVAGEIGARAAMRITDAECNRLADILDNLERAAALLGHCEEAEDYDYDFHRRVNASGAAPKLVWLLNTVVPYARHVFRGTGDDTEMFDAAGRRAILTASAQSGPRRGPTGLLAETAAGFCGRSWRRTSRRSRPGWVISTRRVAQTSRPEGGRSI